MTTEHDPYRGWRSETLHRRELAGYSAAQAAHHAGISSQRWRNLERGHEVKGGTELPANPSRLTVVKMARALRWDVAAALEQAGFGPARPDELDPQPHTSGRGAAAEVWSQLDPRDQDLVLLLMARLSGNDTRAEWDALSGPPVGDSMHPDRQPEPEHEPGTNGAG